MVASQGQPLNQPQVIKSPVTQPTVAEPAPALADSAPPPRKTLADLIMEHFVKLEDLSLPPHNRYAFSYRWRGLCTKCGWHTHQFDKNAATELTFKHAQQHWRDIAPLLQSEVQP